MQFLTQTGRTEEGSRSIINTFALLQVPLCLQNLEVNKNATFVF